MEQTDRRTLLIAKGWIQAIVIVVVCGFLILGMLAYRTYTDASRFEPVAAQAILLPRTAHPCSIK